MADTRQSPPTATGGFTSVEGGYPTGAFYSEKLELRAHADRPPVRDPGHPVTTVDEADGWIGRVAVDSRGRRIGRITRIWVDDYSGLPAWATVEIGRLGRREATVPLSGATAAGGRQRLACAKQMVTSAPHVVDDRHLGLDDEWRLINHYNMASPADPTRVDPGRALPTSGRGMATSTSTGLDLPPPEPGTPGNPSPE